MQSYAFSFNKNYKKSDLQHVSDYDVVLSKLEEGTGKIIFKTFEVGTKQKRLHVHGVVDLVPGTMPHLATPGFTFAIKPIHNYQGWVDYCRKDELVRDTLSMELHSIRMMEYYPAEDVDPDMIDVDNGPSPSVKLF